VIYFRLEFFKKGYNNRYHPFLVNVVINMCDVISKRNFIPYGTIFWKILKEYSNVNHSCPLTVKIVMILISIDQLKVIYFAGSSIGTELVHRSRL